MFKNIFTPLLDFIFPTSETTNSFESNPENMLKIFPAAKISNGFTCLFAYQNNSVKELVWEIKYYKNQKSFTYYWETFSSKILEQAKGTNHTLSYQSLRPLNDSTNAALTTPNSLLIIF